MFGSAVADPRCQTLRTLRNTTRALCDLTCTVEDFDAALDMHDILGCDTIPYLPQVLVLGEFATQSLRIGSTTADNN